MLGNKQYCYPLTITDYRSRYLLTCEGLTSTRTDFAFSVFERAFKDFGLPNAIRTDNGVPFASGNALFGLSKLSVWWLRLGINLQRIKPGHPEQNGRHERMHLTLKKEATKPASFNFLQQQDALMTSSGFTTTSAHIRASTVPTPAISIHLQPARTSHRPSSNTRIMIEPHG